MAPVFDFLRPELPAGLRRVAMPVVVASPETLQGYGFLVDDPVSCAIEITRWPTAGWRAVDEDTGDQAGTTEGVFVAEWQGDILYGRNEAVGGHYILAYAADPAAADATHSRDPQRNRVATQRLDVDGGLHCTVPETLGVRPAGTPGRAARSSCRSG